MQMHVLKMRIKKKFTSMLWADGLTTLPFHDRMSSARCLVTGCRFFSNDGCYGTCSAHSTYKPVKIISIVCKKLPKEVLDLIWDYYYVDNQLCLSDQDIKTIMGSSRFVDTDKVNELVYRFSNATMPYIHCDNMARALQYLSINGRKKFLTSDAIRIMDAIISRNNHEHTVISFQKVLVLLNFHSATLPNDLFSVGKCYFGGRLCKQSMSADQIVTNLQHNDQLSLTHIGY